MVLTESCGKYQSQIAKQSSRKKTKFSPQMKIPVTFKVVKTNPFLGTETRILMREDTVIGLMELDTPTHHREPSPEARLFSMCAL